MMVRSVIGILELSAIAASLSGCAIDTGDEGEPELGVALGVCVGCGNNGMDAAQFDALPLDLNRPELESVGLWPGNADGPLSLCDPATVSGDRCEARPEWRTWIDGALRRQGTFIFLVRVAARPGFTVVAGDLESEGAFGLARSVLTGSWGAKEQEIISGGLSAVFNHAAVSEFEVCLKTPELNSCSSAHQFVESIFYGNVLTGVPRSAPGGAGGPTEPSLPGRQWLRAMSGGPDAPNPLLNLRIGGTGSPDHFDELHDWDEKVCDMNGVGWIRRATTCDRGRWLDPVTVLTTFPPSNSYYDTELPRPDVP